MKANDTDNLIVNGDFSGTDLAGWKISSVSGAVPYNGGGDAVLPNLATISQTVETPAGSTYLFSYEMDLENDATGYVSVTSLPSNATLFSASVSGSQSAISLIPTDTNDTSMVITFDCTKGGELHADNVVLVAAEQGVLVGGDFTDADLPGWVKSGSGSMPSATGGHMKLPAGSAAYQDIAIATGAMPELSYGMAFSDGAAGTFTVTSLPSKTVLHTNSQALSDAVIHFSLSEGDTVARLTFSCASGEVDVSPLTMGYADADSVITEQPLGGHDIPWIYPDHQGDITFTIKANNPEQSNSYLYFKCAEEFSLLDATIKDHEGNCSFEVTSHKSVPTLDPDVDVDANLAAKLTINTDITEWDTCILTLWVLDLAARIQDLKVGSIQYYVNDQPVGDETEIHVFTGSDNVWDNVVGVSKCVIAMASNDESMSSQATLFANYAPDGTFESDGTTPANNAHSIPVFIGMDFTLVNAEYPGPTANDIKMGEVLSLVNSIGGTVEDCITIAGSDTFLQPYNPQSTSDTFTLTAGAFTVELPSFNIWCPVDDGSVPSDVDLCFKLTAPRTDGTYVFESSTNELSKLAISFLANKTYTSPDPNAAPDSSTIVITSIDNQDYLKYEKNNVPYSEYDDSIVIYNIAISNVKENGIYEFKFAQTVDMVFVYPPSVESGEYGTVNAVWVDSTVYNDQWNYFAEFLLLPSRNINVTGKVDLTQDSTYGDSSDDYLVGYVADHEDSGWISGGKIYGVDPDNDDNITNVYPANTIGFVRFVYEIKHATQYMTWWKNDSLQSDGSSRMHLIDNFGNHIFMMPIFNNNGDKVRPTMTVQINDK